MKIRNGFVSNSSSSSTIVVVNPYYKASKDDFLNALKKASGINLDTADIVKIASDSKKLIWLCSISYSRVSRSQIFSIM